MIKKLMKSIREYKKDSLLSPAMVTLEVIMEVIIPMLMARLIDYGIQAQNLGYIWKDVYKRQGTHFFYILSIFV